MGGSGRSGRGSKPGGLFFLQDLYRGLIPPSVGKLLWAGSSVFLCGEVQ